MDGVGAPIVREGMTLLTAFGTTPVSKNDLCLTGLEAHLLGVLKQVFTFHWQFKPWFFC